MLDLQLWPVDNIQLTFTIGQEEEVTLLIPGQLIHLILKLLLSFYCLKYILESTKTLWYFTKSKISCFTDFNNCIEKYCLINTIIYSFVYYVFFFLSYTIMIRQLLCRIYMYNVPLYVLESTNVTRSSLFPTAIVFPSGLQHMLMFSPIIMFK